MPPPLLSSRIPRYQQCCLSVSPLRNLLVRRHSSRMVKSRSSQVEAHSHRQLAVIRGKRFVQVELDSGLCYLLVTAHIIELHAYELYSSMADGGCIHSSFAFAQLAQTGKPWHFCFLVLQRSQLFLARLEGRGLSSMIAGSS